MMADVIQCHHLELGGGGVDVKQWRPTKTLAVTGAPQNCWENAVRCRKLRLSREIILACLRQVVRQEGFLQLLFW
jgi:hypothetical protein